MWKYVFIVFIFNFGSLEVWKCENMSSLSLFSNSGSLAVWNVEICLHCLNLSSNSGSLDVWKCGNVEICLHCLYLITLEGWKCGNMSSMSLSNNSEVWKCGNVPPLSLSINTESVDMKRNVSSSLTLTLLV